MTKIIGLTGGIATGKSTVSTMFKNQGIPVIDADHIAKSLLEVGSETYHKLIDTFGECILATNKTINRKLLAKKMFNDTEARKKINTIIHPKVKVIIQGEIDTHKNLGHKHIVVDVPLLFESGFDKIVDVTIVVYARKKDQIARLMSRDKIDETYAKQKIKSQFPLSKKKELADYVIDNSKNILETKKAFKRLLKKLDID